MLLRVTYTQDEEAQAATGMRLQILFTNEKKKKRYLRCKYFDSREVIV
jgi:hypothetical protein